MDRTLLVGGMSLIVLLASLVIGAAIIDKTGAVATVVAPNGTLTGETITNVGATFSTFTGFIPIAVMAMVGAVALFYLWSVLGASGRTQ